MAYAQQINQEQEALEQQPELKLSSEARVVLAFKHKTPNRYRLLDKLVRAYIDPDCSISDKRKYLSEKSKKLLVAILKKILNGETPLLNHKYISKATRCKSDQNAKILKELGRILCIQYWDVFTNKNGQNFLRHYTFEINPSIVQELKDARAWNLEFCPDFNRSLYNNKDISNRNYIRSRANFSNSNFNSKNTSTELVETSSGVAKGESGYYQANTKTAELVETLYEAQAVETTSPIPATVTQLKTKSPRLANKRKTKTRDEQKQRKTSHVISNGFLAGGKRFSEIQPYLTEEICEKLRSGSGRAFTNQAIRQITKAIATSERGRQAIFQHINGIVAYLTPALVNEKRDAVKTSGEHYYTLAGMTAEDKLWQKQEKYLASVEQDSITHVCPENQLRAKLANALKKNTAYQLLSSLRKLKLVGSTMQIHLKHILSLTEHEKVIILAQLQATYETVSCDGECRPVEYLEFVVDEQMPIASNSNSKQESEQLKLPEGVWGKIAQSFVVEYGQELYTHWISKLEFEQDETNKSITLKANSGMVKDRIEEQYIPFLTSVAQGLGITTIELI